MNIELINRFAQLSQFWKPEGVPLDWNTDPYIVTPQQLEAFVENVVKECGSLVSTEDATTLYEHFGLPK